MQRGYHSQQYIHTNNHPHGDVSMTSYPGRTDRQQHTPPAVFGSAAVVHHPDVQAVQSVQSRYPPTLGLPGKVSVASFSPGATEIVAALGQAEALVGVSSKCDHPMVQAAHPQVVYTSKLNTRHLTSTEVERKVSELAR